MPAKDPGIKVDKAAYEYIPMDLHKKKNYRDEEGAVKIGPRNFTTIPLKRGRVGRLTSFSGQIPYKEDFYDQKKLVLKGEREFHTSKVQEKPFSQVCKHLRWGTFSNHLDVYGEEGLNLKKKEAKKDEAKLGPDGEPVAPTHDRSFRPGGPKKSLFPTIERFPDYLPNPPKEIKRKIPVEGEEEKPNFKMTHNAKTIPSTSVATNFRNLKSSYPNSFKR